MHQKSPLITTFRLPLSFTPPNLYWAPSSGSSAILFLELFLELLLLAVDVIQLCEGALHLQLVLHPLPDCEQIQDANQFRKVAPQCSFKKDIGS